MGTTWARCSVPIIVGRDDILELLDVAVAEAARAAVERCSCPGQAGLGKTRLIWATSRKARGGGPPRRLGGAVSPQDHQVPARVDPRAGDRHARRAGRSGRCSEDLLAIDGRHDGDALGARRLIVRAVADRILEAIDRPTMLIFEDLHWTDEISLEVIGELARHAPERPLLLIADYRADEFPADTIHREWRARLLSQRHAEEVAARPLTLEETGIATTLILGGELPAPRDVVEAVHERTNGIPLHIEELLARPRRRRSDGRPADPRGARPGHDRRRRSCPRRAPVGRRPDGRPGGRRRRPLLQPGRHRRHGRSSARRARAAASRSSSTRRSSIPFDYVDEGYFDFRHQLLRDAIYGSVPPAAAASLPRPGRRVRHEPRGVQRHPRLAPLRAGGLRPQAFRAAMTGAQEASRISARHEAFELYQRAIANMPAGPAGRRAGGALRARSPQAAGAIEHNDEAADAAEACPTSCTSQAGRPIERGRDADARSAIAARRGGAPRETSCAFIEQASRS